MIKLAELKEMWEKDAPIDKLELGDAAVTVPKLHAKYTPMLASIRLQQRAASVSFHKMRKLRSRYYRGELSKEELTQLEWPQYLLNKPLKADLEDFLICDEHLIKLGDKLELLNTLAEFLESIIKSIQSRGWDVKNAITWTQYTNGIL